MTAPKQPTPPNRQIEDRWAAKLWLWKNGDHYLAFDSELPTYDGGDPKTLGEPVGYALLEWETYDRMTEQVAAQRTAEAVESPPEDDLLRMIEHNVAVAAAAYCRSRNSLGRHDNALLHILEDTLAERDRVSQQPIADPPTPPPGDAGERARAIVTNWYDSGPYVEQLIADVAAALQSERTAAASQVRRALDESVKLQSHYAALLNDYDGGKRLAFASADEWIARLRALATPQESAS